jgi:hypothetical protein
MLQISIFLDDRQLTTRAGPLLPPRSCEKDQHLGIICHLVTILRATFHSIHHIYTEMVANHNSEDMVRQRGIG